MKEEVEVTGDVVGLFGEQLQSEFEDVRRDLGIGVPVHFHQSCEGSKREQHRSRGKREETNPKPR